MSDPVLIAVLGLIVAPVASLITWLANRKKHVADIYGIITNSAQTTVETMQSTMETLNEELLHAQEKIETLIEENKQMRAEIVELRKQNDHLIAENAALSQKVTELMEMLTRPF